MGQRTKGGMYCANCGPVLGVKTTHRARNTASVVLLPFTAGLSVFGVRSERYSCPRCGGRVKYKTGNALLDASAFEILFMAIAAVVVALVWIGQMIWRGGVYLVAGLAAFRRRHKRESSAEP